MHGTLAFIILLLSVFSSWAAPCAGVVRLNTSAWLSSDWRFIGSVRMEDIQRPSQPNTYRFKAMRRRFFAKEQGTLLPCFRVKSAAPGRVASALRKQSLLYVESRCNSTAVTAEDNTRRFTLRMVEISTGGRRRETCVDVVVTFESVGRPRTYGGGSRPLRRRRAVNQNAPKFTKTTYNFAVSENQSPGMFVGEISANDPDAGDAGVVVYSMKFLNDVRTEGKFEIDATTGKITTRVALNREKMDKHEFEVKAVDKGSPKFEGKASLVIRVLDENDNNPVFDRLSYTKSIYENVAVGHQAEEVHATDIDFGVNGSLVYSLLSTGNINGAFTIVSSSGQIKTAKSLDRETVPRYVLTAVATDEGPQPRSATVPVTIILNDVNDSPPKFTKLTYQENVDEDIAVSRTVVTVTANSDDLGQNGRVVYSITAGNDDGTFGIGHVSGSIYVAKSLDYESHTLYTLTIKAQDGGTVPLSATASVDIQVNNVNDNAPHFEHDPYRKSIREGDTPQKSFLTVLAVDDDKGTLGDVTYRISAPADIQAKFSIGSTSGNIDIVTHLDFESKSSYQFTVIAEDGGQSPASGQTTIRVGVTDVNDEVPQFTKTLYTEKISEAASKRTPVLQVSANDKDLPSNGQLLYKIGATTVGNPFRINSLDGIIEVAAALDRERKDVYVFVVEATDGELTNTTQVKVTIEDENDSSPTFKGMPYIASIEENRPFNTTVYTVSAEDADIGDNGAITFSIQQTSNLFSIDPKSGVVRTAAIIDFETTEFVLLKVLATDHGTSPKQSSAELSVTVRDENDNKPEFMASPLYTSGSVSEEAIFGTLVLFVSATDKDELNSNQLKYSFVENVTDFSISELSGAIRVAASLDAETEPVYHFQVQAVDSGIPPQTGVVNVTVTIVDVVDNPPQFSKLLYEASVFENSDLRSFVTQVKATSRDSSVPDSDIRFSIRGGNDPKTFEIDPQSGVITLIAEVDAEILGDFFLLVRAELQHQFSDVRVNVQVLDENDNPPQVLPLTMHLIVIEGFFRRTTIGKVRAIDPDPTAILIQDLVGTLPSDFIEFDNATGSVIALPGISQGEYVINTTVSDGQAEAWGLTHIDVTMVSNATFDNAIVLRIDSFTRERIVKDHLDKLRASLAKWIPCRQEDIQIFSVESFGSLVDVLFAVKKADGSGGFISRNDVVLQMDLNSSPIEKESGLLFDEVNVDLCLREPCKNFQACTNQLAVQTETNAIFKDDVLFLSLQRRISYTCTCPSGFVHSWNPNSCLEQINSCLSEPCLFGGTCVNILDGFECKCRHGTIGNRCEIPCPSLSCALCEPNPCLNGGVCSVDSNGMAFSCRCPSGFDGPLCEQTIAHFDYGSLLAFSPPFGRWKLSFSLEFSTVDPNGLIMYNSRLGEQYDFVALELVGGQLYFLFSFGSSTAKAVAKSQTSLADGQWHTVTVNLANQVADLSVTNCQNPDTSNDALIYEDDFICSGSKKPEGETKSLDLDGPLYFAGVENIDFRYPTSSLNFSGCMRNIEVNGKLLDLASARKSINTLNSCPPKSRFCDSNPCLEGGACADVWNGFYCSCPTGNDGPQCSVVSAFQFDGQAYTHHHLSKPTFLESFSVTFRTSNLDATLFSTATTLLQLRNGHVQLIFNVTSLSEAIFMTNVIAVNDGLWHDITVTFKEGTELSLDYGRFTATTSYVETATVTNVYVGGRHIGSKNVIDEFSGCLDAVQINGRALPFVNGISALTSRGGNLTVKTTSSPSIKTGCDSQVMCASLQCPAHSRCMEPASCECSLGRKGRQCVDVCLVNPCKHDGLCSHTSENRLGFACKCNSLYIGTLCETTNTQWCLSGFYGFPNCRPCVCNVEGTNSEICDSSSGGCLCKVDTYSPKEDVGCQLCECSVGATSTTCDQLTGKCQCQPFVVGRRCDQCADGYAGLDEKGCREVTQVEGSLLLTNEVYWSLLGDRTSSQFMILAGALSRAMETLYVGLAGTQEVKVTAFQRAAGERVLAFFTVISYTDDIGGASVNELLWVLDVAMSHRQYGSFLVESVELKADCSSDPCFPGSTCSPVPMTAAGRVQSFTCSSCPGPGFAGDGIVCISQQHLCSDKSDLTDVDNDGIGNICDNCVYEFNPQQSSCQSGSNYCQATAFEGVYWPRAPDGAEKSRPCPAGLVGTASRRCKGAGWAEPSLVDCVSDEVAQLLALYEELEQGKVFLESDAIAVVEQLKEITSSPSAENSNIESAIRIVMGVIQYETDAVSQVVNSQYEGQEKLFKSLLEVISNVLMEDNAYSWERIRKNGSLPGAASLMQKIESMAAAASATDLVSSARGNQITWAASHIALHMVSFSDRPPSSDVIFPVNDFAFRPIGPFQFKEGTAVSLPADIFPSSGTNGVAFVVYNTLHKILSNSFEALGNNSGSKWSIASHIISVGMSDSNINTSFLAAPVNLTFSHNQPLNESSTECSFWKFQDKGTLGGSWSTEGCTTVFSNSTQTTCQCHHLTSFGVAADDKSGLIDLNLFVIISCCFTIGCLVILTLASCCSRKASSDRMLVLLNLDLAIVMSELFFVIGIGQENSDTCTAMAVILHFFCAAIFSWVVVEILGIYYLAAVKNAEKTKIPYYLGVGWGLPALITVITVGIRLDAYKGNSYCFLTLKESDVWAFSGLAVLSIAAFFIVFAMIFDSRKKLKKKLSPDDDQLPSVKMPVVCSCLILLFLVTLFVFGRFYLINSTSAWSYGFGIINLLLGLVLFITQLLQISKLRKWYMGESSKSRGQYHVSSAQPTRSILSGSFGGDKTNLSVSFTGTYKSHPYTGNPMFSSGPQWDRNVPDQSYDAMEMDREEDWDEEGIAFHGFPMSQLHRHRGDGADCVDVAQSESLDLGLRGDESVSEMAPVVYSQVKAHVERDWFEEEDVDDIDKPPLDDVVEEPEDVSSDEIDKRGTRFQHHRDSAMDTLRTKGTYLQSPTHKSSEEKTTVSPMSSGIEGVMVRRAVESSSRESSIPQQKINHWKSQGGDDDSSSLSSSSTDSLSFGKGRGQVKGKGRHGKAQQRRRHLAGVEAGQHFSSASSLHSDFNSSVTSSQRNHRRGLGSTDRHSGRRKYGRRASPGRGGSHSGGNLSRSHSMEGAPRRYKVPRFDKPVGQIVSPTRRGTAEAYLTRGHQHQEEKHEIATKSDVSTAV
eukprot:m.16707 g.16707  ORF g.16707 m.16707 type:complete len:3154 (+) comp27089_c0_seq1:214-9675(+)